MGSELLQSIPTCGVDLVWPVQHLDIVLQQADIATDHTPLGLMQMPPVHVSPRLPCAHGQSGSSWDRAHHPQLVRRHQYTIQSAGVPLPIPCQLVPAHPCEVVHFREEVRETEGETGESTVVPTRARGVVALLAGLERKPVVDCRVSQRECN